jgi:hypothetical protein
MNPYFLDGLLKIIPLFWLGAKVPFYMIRGMTMFRDFIDENAQGAPSKISWHFPLILLIFWRIFLGPRGIDKNIAVFILFSNHLLWLFFIVTHLTILKGYEVLWMMNISFRIKYSPFKALCILDCPRGLPASSRKIPAYNLGSSLFPVGNHRILIDRFLIQLIVMSPIKGRLVLMVS